MYKRYTMWVKDSTWMSLLTDICFKVSFTYKDLKERDSFKNKKKGIHVRPCQKGSITHMLGHTY
jgi:hypothetical protein